MSRIVSLIMILFIVSCVPMQAREVLKYQPGTVATTTNLPPKKATANTPSTASPTPTKISSTLTSEPTLTLVPSPVAVKITPKPQKVILVSLLDSFTDGGRNWPDDCLLWTYRYQFVLYEDGQLILYTQDELLETKLNKQEVDDLLRKIKETGFFEVPDGFDERGYSFIYQTPVPEKGDGGPSRTITVNGKQIIIKDNLRDYLIKPIINVERILENYHPASMKRFVPEELLVESIDVTNSPINNLNYPEIVKPDPTVIPWPSILPKLVDLTGLHTVARVQENDISNMLSAFPKFPMVRLFSENGKLYSVVACPLLPE